ncbi:DUF917 domain-containing protein [Nocardia farcinica]|uniref:DUF917 domain-containing protein n=1 Tax=Nocardia farcinica TaxID=37329 RepID=UPI001895E386|nr:DUF917 domain-containing protein [Nocardia farcinica]MBF6271588.1 DUF917 domain-containing protein [Nocardia farcinica]
MRYIDETALDDIALGATILGAGGGGDPYVGRLLAREQIRVHGDAPLVALDSLTDDDQLCFVAAMGAPGVLVEKLPRVDEAISAVRALEKYLGAPFTHIAPIEAGGLNAVVPFSALALGLPIVDADGMGRAFPALEHVTPTLHGGSATPLSMTDEHGNAMVLTTTTNQWSETLMRATTVASGCCNMMALYPMTGAQAKQWLIPGVLTLAEDLGRLVRTARAEHRSAAEAVVRHRGGVILFDGKVVAVDRANTGGFTLGSVTLEGHADWQGQEMTIRFQNENIVAIRDGEIVATVPDIIMLMTSDSGQPITAEEVKFGYRLSVLGLPCDERWRTEAGIALTGPRAFGYDADFRPVEAAL